VDPARFDDSGGGQSVIVETFPDPMLDQLETV
jgi:hypothetical protein